MTYQTALRLQILAVRGQLALWRLAWDARGLMPLPPASRTPPEWHRLTKADLYVQTVQQAAKIRELLDEIERLLISHESLNQALGETLNEVTYWQQRATEAEQRLPDRLRIIPNEPG